MCKIWHYGGMEKSSSRMAIVGGGPSGLLSAYYALQQGQPAADITVYEASARTGGHAGGKGAENLGPEFIDSRHKNLIAIAKKLNVELEPSAEQQRLSFQRPNGKRITQEEFFTAYKPMADLIREDKQRAAFDPDFARTMDGKPMDTYLKELATRAEAARVSKRTYMGFASETLMPWTRPRALDPDISTIVSQAYASEAGRPPARVSSLQFLREMSAERDKDGLPCSLMDSDCAYRVKGGMEVLYARMREDMEEKGVKFETGKKLKSIARKNGRTQLDFGDDAVEAERVVLAVPAHALGNLEGMESLGFSAEQAEQLSQLQYTQNAKFTVRMKEGVQLEEENFYASSGYQMWPRPDGTATFLMGGDMMQGKKGKDLVMATLQDYAKARGQRVEDVFDVAEGNVTFNAPGANNPCYPSPMVGQVLVLDRLKEVAARLTTQGIALVGNYMPTGEGIGFMENAAESARLAQQSLLAQASGGVAIPSQQRSTQRGASV